MLNLSKSEAKKGIDLVLVAVIICLLMYGLFALFSASQIESLRIYSHQYFLFGKQLCFVLFGLILLYISSKVDYKKYKGFGIFIFLFSLILLLLVLFTKIGVYADGAKRWARIGPLCFSPTVLVIISMIIYLSGFLAIRLEEVNRKNVLIIIWTIIYLPIMLILMQPNSSHAILYFLVGTSIIYFAGVRLFYSSIIIVVVFLTVYYHIIRYSYQAKRVLTFLNPMSDPYGAGYQLLQSLTALGSGGITGVGFDKGIQKHYYLPDVYSTFILSSTGEELGFVGTTSIIILIFIFILRGFQIAYRTDDAFGKILASGITTWIGIQSALNICVVSGLVPVGALSLPFFSYGGSEMICHLFAVGILLNISYQTGCYFDYVGMIGNQAKKVIIRFNNVVNSISLKIESHPAYRVFALVALLLSLIVSIIQIIYYFFFNK